MPNLFEGSGQFDLPQTTDTDIFTGSEGYQSTVRVFLCNRTAAAIAIRLALSRAGAALDDSHYLYYEKDVPANDSLIVEDLPVDEADVIRAWAADFGVSANVLVQDARAIAEIP